ncbi:MAG: hypothetical protein ACRC7Q_07675 [Plesiomonas shigelloides]
MSLIYPNRYPGRWDPTSAQYPQGKFKNRSSPTAKDGSFCEMDWANDWAGFFGAILKNAGVTPNGSVDTAIASQLYSALIGGIIKTAGLRDVGVGANQIPDMSSWVSGENGNGAYYRLPGGLQVCRFTMSISPGANTTWTYPLAFVSKPQILHSTLTPGGDASKALWTSASSLTQCNVFNPNSVGVNACVTAIL